MKYLPFILMICILSSCGKPAKNDEQSECAKSQENVDSVLKQIHEMREAYRPDTFFVYKDPFDSSAPPMYQHVSFYFGPRYYGEGFAEVKVDLDRFIEEKAEIINDCYKEELKNQPGLKGMLSLKIILYPSGKVNDIVVSKNTIGDKVRDCVIKTYKQFTFPTKGKGPITVRFPLVFTP